MTGFLAELGRKLAERWVDVLLLPGLLWIATLTAGVRLGQQHPADVGHLRGWLDQLAAHPAAHSPATVLLAAAGILLACAAAGLAAAALGGLLQHLWVLPGHLPPTAWLLSWRTRRWDRATRALRTAIAHAHQPTAHGVTPARAAAKAARRQRHRARLGTARPTRPTRIGQRLHQTSVRIAAVNGLDELPTVWPRLWTVLPDPLRGDITAANDAYTAAARLAAWGLLYTGLAAAWWPAGPLGLTILIIATVRARAAAGVLADLIETAADLHTRDLADRLAIPTAPTTIETGRAITAWLRAAPSTQGTGGAEGSALPRPPGATASAGADPSGS